MDFDGRKSRVCKTNVGSDGSVARLEEKLIDFGNKWRLLIYFSISSEGRLVIVFDDLLLFLSSFFFFSRFLFIFVLIDWKFDEFGWQKD